jgi:hypothetical protein
VSDTCVIRLRGYDVASGTLGRLTAGDDRPSVSGTLVCGLLQAGHELVGAEAVARGLSALAPGIRAHVADAIPGQWVPIASAEEAFRCIAEAANRDWPALHAELARHTVERAYRTFWRMLLRLTTDGALVSRTPVIFAKSYNRGRLVASILFPGRGEVELVDWADAPDWPIRGTQAGIETGLRIAGRRNVRVESKRTQTGASFHVTWR